MHAIARINTFDQTRFRQATDELVAFQKNHASQPGYAGSLTIDIGNGRQLVVNLWETEAQATAALGAIGPEVRRVLEPLMRAPSELIGAGPVLAFDLLRPGK